MTLTVGEPLEDVSGSANHDFWTLVTGISSEIDASKKKKLSIELTPCNNSTEKSLVISGQE